MPTVRFIRTWTKMDEQSLVKLYMELTGSPEPVARSVVMQLLEKLDADRHNQEPAPEERIKSKQDSQEEGTGRVSLRQLRTASASLVLCAALWALAGQGRAAETNTGDIFQQPLSLPDAINIALRRSPVILRAQRDVQATEGVAIQTRAIALPKLGVTGDFSAVEPRDVDRPPVNIPGFTFGTDKSWHAQTKIVQSLYEGGRMVSAFRIARLSREQSLLNYQTAAANTIADVEAAYDDVLLAEQQIKVQEASLQLLEQELADTRRRFEAGTLPQFNVLRAEVEVANARPRVIRARNAYRISKNNMANLLGWNVPRETLEDIPLKLSGRLELEPYEPELSQAIRTALARRTELKALRKAEALREAELRNARAGYKPALQAFAGYDAHSSIFSPDLTREQHGWISGVQLNWNVFDGLQTKGKVAEARALLERAVIDLDDSARRIELDVRTAFSNFIEAREVVESQKKVLEQGEEALRLARARNEAGTGTQLDVLSAQTALTEARTTEIQARHDYAVARVRLDRATGMNVPRLENLPQP
jgi:outer membrane protein